MSRCGVGLVEVAFDRTDPNAVAFVESRGAELVVDVTRETRLAVRNVIARAFREGISPARAARMVREIIGLTDAQAQAVMSLREKLRDEGVGSASVDRQASAYAKRLLKQRAENIARTETMRASNEGQHQLWRQAQAKGYLPAGQQRVWIVTRDERACPICSALAGKRVGMRENFAPGVSGPPAHPSCRCTQGLAPARKPAA